MNPKYRLDVSQQHRATIEENRKRMKEIETEKPDEFFHDKEWRKLNEENRQAMRNIQNYEDSIDRGAKY